MTTNELNQVKTARSLHPAQTAPVRRENNVAAAIHAGVEASIGFLTLPCSASPFAGVEASIFILPGTPFADDDAE